MELTKTIKTYEVSKAGLWEYRKLVFRSFLKKKLVVVGCAVTVLMTIIALAAPVLVNHDIYEIDVLAKQAAPSALHFFGTDHLGRDVFSRTLFGTRVSMTVGLFTAGVAFLLGTLLGLMAGYFSRLDNIIMRVCEGMMAIPPILMAIALVAALGATTMNVIIALSIVYTPTVARVARASALSVKEMTYIEAERAQGAGWPRIVFRHIFPNILSPVVVQTTYIFASAIIIEAALSFLGAGVPAPEPSLGNMLFEAKSYLYNAWWMMLFPAIFMVLIVLGLNLFGDGIRDIFDPQSN